MSSPQTTIDTVSVVRYLSKAFSTAQADAVNSKGINRDSSKGSELYGVQVEFCYLIDDITRGPVYICSKRISAANHLIAELERRTIKKEDSVKEAPSV